MADTAPAVLSALAKADTDTVAGRLINILATDYAKLIRLNRYQRGEHDPVINPDSKDPVSRALAKIAVTNMVGLMVSLPADVLAVDGYQDGDGIAANAAWLHWQRSGLDAGQRAIFHSALTHGHSFTLTELVDGKARTRGLSPLRTVALYDDATHDVAPVAALYVHTWPTKDQNGWAYLWDRQYRWTLRLPSEMEIAAGRRATATGYADHGGKGECPVTRVACQVDLEGRTTGLVEPSIVAQDALNKARFDLLKVADSSAFPIIWIAGTPHVTRKDSDGNEIIGPDGNPEIVPMQIDSNTVLIDESSETKFGRLPAAELSNHIGLVEHAMSTFAVLTRTPLSATNGKLVNLSSEALHSVELTWLRMVRGIQRQFGESIERIMRLGALMEGDETLAADVAGEVVWRDIESRSIAVVMDALVKEVSIGVPPAEVFEKIPGMTQQRLNRIVKAWSASDPTALQTEYMRKALTQLASSRRAEVAGDASDPAAG